MESPAFFEQRIAGAIIRIEGDREVVLQIVKQMPEFVITRKVPRFNIEKIEYKPKSNFFQKETL